MVRLGVTWITAGVVVCAACTSDDGGDRSVASGREFVPQWTLPRSGGATLDATTDLTDVVGAALLEDGRIAIADAASSQVHYFGADGAHLATLGGAGDGPGEFRTIESLGVLPGDTVWVHDFAYQRLTFIDPELRIDRIVALQPRLGAGLAAGVLETGVVVVGQAWSSARVGAATEVGLNREPVAYAAYSARGELVDTVALVPGREVILSQEDGRGVMSPAPLGRHAVHALVGGRLVVGDQEDPELRVIDLGGGAPDTLRWSVPSLEVTPQMRDAWREERLAGVPASEHQELERSLLDAPWPDRRPAYGDLLPGGAHEIWVADFALPGRTPASWTVLGMDGALRASVPTPDGFRPLAIDGDRVVGVTRDEFGVPTVEVRRLVRG